jgi:hypothetical protein
VSSLSTRERSWDSTQRCSSNYAYGSVHCNVKNALRPPYILM